MHRRLIVAAGTCVVLSTGAASAEPAAASSSSGSRAHRACANLNVDCRNRQITPPEQRMSASSSAADALNWGQVVAGDEFNYTGSPEATKWNVYNSPGHSDKGLRRPWAWHVANGAATVTGDAAGTTGGMSARFASRRYGRWEARTRTNTRDPQYHPVLLLWPDAGYGTKCPEVDYAEGNNDPSLVNLHLHYGCAPLQVNVSKPVDTTRWHNYAVQWTAAGITAYIDGVKWFGDTTASHQPPGSMHACLQLDWFPSRWVTKLSTMSIDWIRVYDVSSPRR